LKRHLVAAPVLALAALGSVPLLAGQASAAEYPPIIPPGVVQAPPGASQAGLNPETACYSIHEHNPVANTSPKTVGAYAFLTRGLAFCPYIDW
jgi:hypothetical protein